MVLKSPIRGLVLPLSCPLVPICTVASFFSSLGGFQPVTMQSIKDPARMLPPLKLARTLHRTLNPDGISLSSTGADPLEVNRCHRTTKVLPLLLSSELIWPLFGLRPWTQLQWWLSWLWLWRWLASVRLFTSKAAWTEMTSCQTQRTTWPTTCWGWWDNKPLALLFKSWV